MQSILWREFVIPIETEDRWIHDIRDLLIREYIGSGKKYPGNEQFSQELLNMVREFFPQSQESGSPDFALLVSPNQEVARLPHRSSGEDPACHGLVDAGDCA